MIAGRSLQVRVQDGRVLVGQLTCLDKQGNIILANTVQVPGNAHAGAPMLHLLSGGVQMPR